jgi:hypothetical protein
MGMRLAPSSVMTESTVPWIARDPIGVSVLALAVGVLVTLSACAPAPLPAPVQAPAAPARAQADFAQHQPSADARRVADWAVGRGDARSRPFLVIDKKRATLYVFDASGALAGVSPVLLGQARGDHSVPGIGERPLSRVRPAERTTPAGRFETEVGRNLQGEDIVWIDYDHAVSLHRVRANDPRQRRLQRLASESEADNRISYGCVNVPAAFYDQVVRPLFYAAPGVAYVLPEVRALEAVFAGLPAAQPL